MSQKLKLSSGRYFVSNKSAENSPVGVQESESSGGSVVVFPRFAKPEPWTFTKNSEWPPVFNITLNDNAAKAEGDKLITSDGAQDEWIVHATPHHGKDVYTIELVGGDRGEGWVCREKGDFAAVNIKPLRATRSLPPQYPATDLWKITPAVED